MHSNGSQTPPGFRGVCLGVWVVQGSRESAQGTQSQLLWHVNIANNRTPNGCISNNLGARVLVVTICFPTGAASSNNARRRLLREYPTNSTSWIKYLTFLSPKISGRVQLLPTHNLQPLFVIHQWWKYASHLRQNELLNKSFGERAITGLG